MGWVIAGEFIGSSASRLLIALLVAAASGLLLVAVTVLLGRRQAKVERQLAGYELAERARRRRRRAGDGHRAAGDGDDLTLGRPGRPAHPRREHARTGRPADAAGGAAVLRSGLRGHGVPAHRGRRRSDRRAHRGGIVAVGPFGYVSYRERRRLLAFERQLPDTLDAARRLHSRRFLVHAGLETVADETADAMRRELQRVFTEARLGRPIEEALDETAERMESHDLRGRSWRSASSARSVETSPCCSTPSPTR